MPQAYSHPVIRILKRDFILPGKPAQSHANIQSLKMCQLADLPDGQAFPAGEYIPYYPGIGSNIIRKHPEKNKNVNT